jgi:hypothetical protein
MCVHVSFSVSFSYHFDPLQFHAPWPYLPYDFHLYSKYILKDKAQNFGKGGKFIGIFKDLLGDGIFNSNGPNWELQRKIAAKIFTGFMASLLADGDINACRLGLGLIF